ncbi:MAG: hypothetical protein HQL50_03130 [Magnetococcales bacterium]|nr:hypothetical protein [Magnetococcales bacterium]
MKESLRTVIAVVAALALFGGDLLPIPSSDPDDGVAYARSKSKSSSRSYSSSSRSSSSRSSYSRSSSSSGWGRDKRSTSRYSKPSSSRSSSSARKATSSRGYSKPGSSSYSKPATSRSSSGYGKPKSTSTKSSSGYGKPASSGYAKPSSTSRTSSGYSKPGSVSSQTSSKTVRKPVVTSRTQSRSTFEKSMARSQSLDAKRAYDRSKQPVKPKVTATRTYSSRQPKTVSSSKSYRKGSTYYKKKHHGPDIDLDDMVEAGAAMAGAYMGASMAGGGEGELLQENAAHFQQMAMQKRLEEESSWKKDLNPTSSLSDRSKLLFSTGGSDGVYHLFCSGDQQSVTGFRAMSENVLDAQCVTSGGSSKNLDAFTNGKADAVIAQADVIDIAMRNNRLGNLGPYQMTLYQEPFWLLVNEKGSIADLDDLDAKKHTIITGPVGSGTHSAWRNLAEHAAQPWFLGFGGKKIYSRMKTQSLAYREGAAHVARNRNSAMLVVMGLGSPLMQWINDTYGDALKLVPFEDKRFVKAEDREGNPVYDACTIPGNRYPALQEGWLDTSVDTLCVDAVLLVSPRWVAVSGKQAEKAFVAASKLTIPQVRNRVAGE